MPYWLIVPSNEDVSLVNDRCDAWSLWVDAHYHRARFIASVDSDRSEAKAEIARSNAPVALEVRRDAFDRV